MKKGEPILVVLAAANRDSRTNLITPINTI